MKDTARGLGEETPEEEQISARRGEATELGVGPEDEEQSHELTDPHPDELEGDECGRDSEETLRGDRGRPTR